MNSILSSDCRRSSLYCMLYIFSEQITNQMIETCKQYITSRNTEPIWKQERVQVCQKLNDCIRLNTVYHNSYALVQQQNLPATQNIATQFKFSENYVFGKFDAFCNRLKKIILLFDLIEDYNKLFERRMEGRYLRNTSMKHE